MKVATFALARTVLTVALFFAIAETAFAGETVSVRLDDGTDLTAQVDQRTDDDHLWLRFGGGSVVVLRAIDWDHVATAQQNGQSLDRAAVRSLASAAPTPAPRPSETNTTRTDGRTDAERARELLGFRRPVKSVDFDARLANWDGDVEADGIAMRVFPLDSNGALTTVRGTLHVELVASRKVRFIEAPSSRGKTTQRIGKWTVQLDPRQFSQDGALVKLPFRTIHPEFDTSWASHGLVHVRLTVPGHGVFEHSFDGLRVRPFAPLRDQRQRQGQPRFLPTENTGVSKVLGD